jgi:hypothetical protein
MWPVLKIQPRRRAFISCLWRARRFTFKVHLPSKWHVRGLSKAAMVAFCLISLGACAQELSLSPTRPTIANSAAIQNRGELQVEIGYDAYPRHLSGNYHAAAANFYYVPLDFGGLLIAIRKTGVKVQHRSVRFRPAANSCFTRRITESEHLEWPFSTKHSAYGFRASARRLSCLQIINIEGKESVMSS